MGRDDSVPRGRLRRLAHVAAMGPRAGLAIARDALSRDGGELGEVLYGTLGQLKGGTLKAGQLFAQVADALPEATRVRVGRLFASAPPLPWPAVAEVIASELGPPDAVFASIEPEPFAAASLGQVHRARLPEGAVVAVKVQYPGVADALAHDLELVERAAGAVTAGGLLFDARDYFRAVRDDTLAELDYRREAAHLEQMAAAVARWPDLVVPRLYRDRSTEHVLTTELLEGETLNDAFDRPSGPVARRELGLRLVRAVLGPPLVADVVNADAHPGNFVVLPGDRLGLLDFGAVTTLAPGLGARLRELVLALVRPGPPPVDALAAAGVRFHPADHEVFVELAEVVARPLRGPRDFASDPTLRDLGAFKQRHPIAMVRARFEPALMPVLRAMIGVQFALRRLAVEADVGALLAELASERA